MNSKVTKERRVDLGDGFSEERERERERMNTEGTEGNEREAVRWPLSELESSTSWKPARRAYASESATSGPDYALRASTGWQGRG